MYLIITQYMKHMDTLFEFLGCTTGEPQSPFSAWALIGSDKDTGYKYYAHWAFSSGDGTFEVFNDLVSCSGYDHLD